MLIDQRLILVSPSDVVKSLISLVPQREFIASIGASTLRIVSGFMLGLCAGTLLAVFAVKNRFIKDFISPFMATVKAVPVASFTILALFLIPSKNLSILVTLLIALPVVYSNILTGIESTDKGLLEVAELFNISPVRKTVFIYFSQILPYFRAACSTASGLSWKSGVAAELIVIARGTIGERLYDAKTGFEMDKLFAWTLVVILLSYLTELVLKKLTDAAWHIIQKV